MEQNKKEWVKPELYVLLKSRPEESVLVGCKTEIEAGAPTRRSLSNCTTSYDETGHGWVCKVMGSS